MAPKAVKSLATIVALIAAVPVGLFFIWLFLLGVCNFPPLAFSAACGHNAWVWLPVLVPAGFYLAWKLLSLINNKAFPPAVKQLPAHQNDA
jgi:hypothetical protein